MRKDLGLDQTNWHDQLILDRHNSHMTLEVVKISMEAGLDIVSLPSYTSHVLQPLDIAYYVPFKTTFRKYRDLWSMRNTNGTVRKQKLCEWTSKALKVAITPQDVKVDFPRLAFGPWIAWQRHGP